MSKLTRIIGLSGAIVALTACMGTEEAAYSAGTGLVEVEPGTQPLLAFDSATSMGVSEACGDRIPGEVEFQIASDGRVVALNLEGVPVCADSVENVQEELANLGRVEEADSLGAAYLVTLGLAIPGEGWDRGDPSPQPSSQPDGPRPESGMRIGSAPGDEVEEADPSPQPS